MLCAALPFLNSLHGPWILDDYPLIAQNPFVRSPARWASLWTSDYWASTGADSNLYRPLPMTTYAITYAIAGSKTWAYHLTNIALHAICTLLVWRVGMNGRRTIPALVCSLVFAFHPIHVEAVANVVGRAELLLASGFLGMLTFHRRAMKAEAASSAATIGFAEFLCASIMLFSKETGVLLLAYILIEDAGSRRLRVTTWHRLKFLQYSALVVAAVLYFLLRREAVTGAILSSQELALHDRLMLTASAALKNLQLLLLPWQQQALWRIPDLARLPGITLPSGTAVVALLAGSCIVAAWTGRPPHRALALIALSMALLLHPLPNVIWVWERGLYVPSIGLAWLLYELITRIKPGARQTTALLLLVVLSVAGACRSTALAGLYANELHFWEHQARRNPDDPPTLLSLSEVLVKRNAIPRAIVLRESALRFAPLHGTVIAATAGLYIHAGQPARARDLLTSASTVQLSFPTPLQQGQMLRVLADMAKQLELPHVEARFRARANSIRPQDTGKP